MAESIPAVVRAFDRGSAEFARWTPLLWDPIGAATAEAAPPRPGGRVLDVCCGSGSSAIPAARAVGVDGLVDAVDLARELLDQGVRRAGGLPQLRFHHADASRWTSVDGLPYDRVQCVFGVFFLPDMDAAAAHLVGLLRPGGTFAVTTWRRGSVDDVVGPLVQALTEQTGRTLDRPASAQRAARVDTDEKLAGWLRGLGLGEVDVRPVERDVPLTPDSAWSFVMGSGIRAALDGLDAPVVAAVQGPLPRTDGLHHRTPRPCAGRDRHPLSPGTPLPGDPRPAPGHGGGHDGRLLAVASHLLLAALGNS